MRETFEGAGSLASVDVLAGVCAIGRQASSGTLRITGPGGERVRFGFDAGALVALDPPPESSPSDVLIRAGKLERPTYEALTVGDFEDRFAVAAASGVISRREVNWGLKISAIESLVRVLSWGDGVYEYEEGPPEPTAPTLRLRVDQWVLELFLRSNDRGFVVRKIGPTDIPVARAEGFAGAFGALGLTADADAVVEGIDGKRTIDAVVKRSRADEFATLKLLGALIALGLIRPIHEMPVEESAARPLPGEAEEAPSDAPLVSVDHEAPSADSSEPGDFELEVPGSPAPVGTSPDLPEEPEPEIPAEPEADFSLPAEPARFDDIEEAAPEEPPLETSAPTHDLHAGLPEVSVPLFALTAPEPEAAGESVAPDEPAPEYVEPERRLGTIRAAVVLAVVVGGGIFVLSRRRAAAPPPAPETAPAARSESPKTPDAEAPPSTPRPSAAAPEPEKTETQAPPRVEPAPPKPAGAKPPARPPAKPAEPREKTAEPRAKAAGPPAGAAGTGAASWEALARAGRRTFEHPGPNRYAIQLELACEESTLKKAFDADPGRRRIWLAPYSFRGRDCYRVLWGRYRDLASAKAAKSGIPGIFSRDGNRPAVVPLGRAK